MCIFYEAYMEFYLQYLKTKYYRLYLDYLNSKTSLIEEQNLYQSLRHLTYLPIIYVHTKNNERYKDYE